MNLLEEFFYCNLRPNETAYQKVNKSYARAIDLVAKNEELLTEALEGKTKKEFLEYANAYSEVLGTTHCESFIDGFRVGARFMAEALCVPPHCLSED